MLRGGWTSVWNRRGQPLGLQAPRNYRLCETQTQSSWAAPRRGDWGRERRLDFERGQQELGRHGRWAVGGWCCLWAQGCCQAPEVLVPLSAVLTPSRDTGWGWDGGGLAAILTPALAGGTMTVARSASQAMIRGRSARAGMYPGDTLGYGEPHTAHALRRAAHRTTRPRPLSRKPH